MKSSQAAWSDPAPRQDLVDAMRNFESTEVFEQTLQSTSPLKSISGISWLGTWAARHPLTNQIIVGSMAPALTERREVALLLGRMRYHPALSGLLAELIPAQSHDETAKPAIEGSGRRIGTYSEGMDVHKMIT